MAADGKAGGFTMCIELKCKYRIRMEFVLNSPA